MQKKHYFYYFLKLFVNVLVLMHKERQVQQTYKFSYFLEIIYGRVKPNWEIKEENKMADAY